MFLIVSSSEAIKRATVYLSIANYVSKQLSDAFFKCENRKPCSGENCDINDVRMMEGGLAFYAGSLEGQGKKQSLRFVPEGDASNCPSLDSDRTHAPLSF